MALRRAAALCRLVLVDEGWSATVPVACALARAGFEVTVATAGGPSARCTRRGVTWRSLPSLDRASFLSALDSVVDELAPATIWPLTEAVMVRLWDAAPTWSAQVFPPSDERQRQLLRSKHRMLEYLAARGVAVPRQRRLDVDVDARAIVAELGLPLALKGDTGASGRRVRIVETAGELAPALRAARRLGGEWVAQELAPGATCLVGGLFHEGRPLRLYAAEKVEQYPTRTGPAVRVRSIADAALVEAARRVFAELRLSGVASADFVRARDGHPWFLEVNPRPWASITAAASAGVDLLAPLAELLGGRVPAAALEYRGDVDCRVFPRYLLAPRYRSARGLALAARDLLGPQGEGWRDPGFAWHLVRRLIAARRQMGS